MKYCRINVDLLDGKYQVDVEVEFDYEPFDPGVRYHPDESGTPPSGDYIKVSDVQIISVTNTEIDQTIQRECLVDLSLIETFEASVYDICWESDKGHYIYDAIYNSRDEE